MTRLLVVGISVIDHVHRMDVLPSGGAKFRSHALDVIGGGCGANAAVGAARLGGDVRLLTRLGADGPGDVLAAMLETAGVDVRATRGGRQPVSSVMVDAAGERMIVNFPGAALPQDPPPVSAFDALSADCRWPAATQAALRAARDAGVPSVIDGERHTPEPLAAQATHVVFSAEGVEAFAGIDGPDAALMDAARRLPGRVAYTDGPRGVIWAGGPTISAPIVTPVDTLGAGDLWHGAFALALGRGVALDEASRFANRAAALKCTRAGGWDAYPTAAEMEDP